MTETAENSVNYESLNLFKLQLKSGFWGLFLKRYISLLILTFNLKSQILKLILDRIFFNYTLHL